MSCPPKLRDLAFGCLCVGLQVTMESRRDCWTPWIWNYRQLWAVWNGTELGSSTRAVCIHNHWAMSPASWVWIFYFYFKHCLCILRTILYGSGWGNNVCEERCCVKQMVLSGEIPLVYSSISPHKAVMQAPELDFTLQWFHSLFHKGSKNDCPVISGISSGNETLLAKLWRSLVSWAFNYKGIKVSPPLQWPAPPYYPSPFLSRPEEASILHAGETSCCGVEDKWQVAMGPGGTVSTCLLRAMGGKNMLLTLPSRAFALPLVLIPDYQIKTGIFARFQVNCGHNGLTSTILIHWTGSSNCNSLIKSGQPPMFLIQNLLEHSLTYLWTVGSCFHATMEELNGYGRELTASMPEIFVFWSFTEGCWLLY